MNFLVVIPYVGRPELLAQCLRSLSAREKVLVVDNSTDKHGYVLADAYDALYVNPGTNLGVAGSWNAGLSQGRDLTIFCSAATILDYPVEFWLKVHCQPTKDFVSYAPVGYHFWGLHRETVEAVGLFDENYRNGYCEDTDYYRRLRLAGRDLEPIRDCCVRVSEIGHAAKLLGLKGNENDAYFREKWGCTPNEAGDLEKGWKVPFNGIST